VFTGVSRQIPLLTVLPLLTATVSNWQLPLSHWQLPQSATGSFYFLSARVSGTPPLSHLATGSCHSQQLAAATQPLAAATVSNWQLLIPFSKSVRHSATGSCHSATGSCHSATISFLSARVSGTLPQSATGSCHSAAGSCHSQKLAAATVSNWQLPLSHWQLPQSETGSFYFLSVRVSGTQPLSTGSCQSNSVQHERPFDWFNRDNSTQNTNHTQE